MSDTPGVVVVCPPEAPSSGPIPIDVTMTADMRTYWDNDGIVDKALAVALVRRDRPGVRFLAKTDPSMMLLPDEPLPDRPSDEDLENSKDAIVQEKTLDPLEFGGSHAGAADYHVLAGFAFWTAPPGSMRVTDSAHILPPAAAKEALPARPEVVPPPPGRPGVAAKPRATDAGWIIEGAFRGLGHARLWNEDRAAPPFVSLVAFNLSSRGGASAGVFTVTSVRQGNELAGTFAVPVASLARSPEPGRYRVFVFFGDEAAKPFDFELPDPDEE